MKNFRTTILSVVAGSLAGGLVAWFVPRNLPAREDGDTVESWLTRNLAEVERQVFEDVDRYGADIFRLYTDVAQMTPNPRGSDFGGDKAVKKLEITYPNSHVLAFAEASSAYRAMILRDMLRIERYLETLEQRPPGSPPQLMPNGYEVEPQLLMAQYCYLFQIGKSVDAKKTLDCLAERFPKSWLIQPSSKPCRVSDFVKRHRRVLAVEKKNGGVQ